MGVDAFFLSPITHDPSPDTLLARNHPAYADVYVTAGVLHGASFARVGREEPRVRLAGKNAYGARGGARQ